ncbi:MAG TPA: C-GCAxxG-C-C family protein, partial [Syntrophales bacterium]|nr:C-GCAxxG-C-C family protein [Syntrophales bacterium]
LLILAAILILREKDFFFNRDLAGIDPPYSSIDKVDGPGDSWRRSYECRYASHQWTQRYERTIEKEKMETKELIQSRVHTYYWQDDINCATTNLKILSEVFSIPLSDQVTDAALGMHGAGEYGAQCGLVEGTLMFLGIIGRTKGISDEKIIDSCNAFARQFEHKFQTLLCRELRPEGFHRNNPPHLCEKFTCEAVLFNIDFVTDFTNNY